MTENFLNLTQSIRIYDQSLPNRFNNLFVDIGVSIQEQRCENYNYDDHEQFVHNTPATFRLQSVSDQNVREVLMKIPDKNACGNDNLSDVRC